MQIGKTEIELSKIKITLIFLGSCAFALIGLRMILFDEGDFFGSWRLNSDYFVLSIGILSFTLFGASGLSAFFKIFDNRPGLILDADGFTDNSSAFSVGFIPWQDVVEAFIYSQALPYGQRQKLLFIRLQDPEKYLKNCSSLVRLARRISMRIAGTPISISTVGLKIGLEDLEALFRSYLSKAKQGASSSN